MSQNNVLEGMETHISHIGVVVKDLDKTVEYFTSLGLGPFSFQNVTRPSSTVHGKERSYGVRMAVSQQGPVELELIEYKEGETIHKEFLDAKGEGLHHLQFKVKDLDGTMKKFVKIGTSILQSVKFDAGGGYAYMGTDEPGGVIFEIAEYPPDYDDSK